MAQCLRWQCIGRSCAQASCCLPHSAGQLLFRRALNSAATSTEYCKHKGRQNGWRMHPPELVKLRLRSQLHFRCYASIAMVETAPRQLQHENVDGQNVIEVLRARGLIQDIANEDLSKAAGQQQLKVYCGFDPTADSLHIGNLLGIIVLKWFQKCGHQTVALLGGATGRVGDPSGRSAERPVLSDEEIERNVQGIRKILDCLLQRQEDSAAASPPLILNNLDWFGGMGFLRFLREVGKHARVNVMLSRESVKMRLEREEGITFTEFTYQLLQGYDFFHMNKHHGVNVQLGGSDQMGNILSGLDLTRRLSDCPVSCYGLCFPLLTNSEGVKMGKSVGGAIWLSPDKLSPFKFYQYLLTSTTDADVVKFLRMLTFLSLEDIAALEEHMKSPAYRPNSAQRILAQEVTRFVHGEEGLRQAEAATQALAPGGVTQLDAATLEAIAEEAPSARLPKGEVIGVLLADVMMAVKLQPSKSASKRLIKGGGVRVNNTKIDDENYSIESTDLIEGRLLLLAAGKKNKLLLHVS